MVVEGETLLVNVGVREEGSLGDTRGSLGGQGDGSRGGRKWGRRSGKY